tara:strand:+ start:146 stop:745 length:600 start_codon:yes stop_codon:yes gene_type:complete
MTTYDGHMDLFPTRVSKFTINEQLIKETLKNKRNKKSLYTNVLDLPEYLPLQNEILKTVLPLCPQDINIGDWKIVTGWINNQTPNQNHFPFHAHSDALMSCVVYLKGKNMSLTFRDEAKHPVMSSQESKASIDIAVRRTWYDDVTIPTKPGDLIIFPSYLLHKPDNNKKNEERISIAYNLMPTKVISETTPPWALKYYI